MVRIEKCSRNHLNAVLAPLMKTSVTRTLYRGSWFGRFEFPQVNHVVDLPGVAELIPDLSAKCVSKLYPRYPAETECVAHPEQ